MLEGGDDVDEVLDDAVDDGLVDAFFEFVEFLGELSGDLLGFGRVAFALGAELGEVAG